MDKMNVAEQLAYDAAVSTMRAAGRVIPYDREIEITVRPGGIAVGVYMGYDGSRISGTIFKNWPAVVKLIARCVSSGNRTRVVVREDMPTTSSGDDA